MERCENINKSVIRSQNIKMANKALRVIAVGYKELTTLPLNISSESVENNLKFWD